MHARREGFLKRETSSVQPTGPLVPAPFPRGGRDDRAGQWEGYARMHCCIMPLAALCHSVPCPCDLHTHIAQRSRMLIERRMCKQGTPPLQCRC